MNLIKLLPVVLLALSISLISCNGDDDKNFSCDQISEKITEASSALSNAQTEYANDPTSENCEKVIEEYNDYFDVYERALDCFPTIYTNEALNSIREARDEYNEDNNCD